MASKNLIDNENNVQGFLLKDGSLQENETYTTSDLIPVEGNTAYFFSVRTKSNISSILTTRHVILLYDIDKLPIAASYTNVQETEGLLIETDGNAAYIRCCSAVRLLNAAFQLEKGTAYTAYENYYKFIELTARLGAEPMEQVAEIAKDQTSAGIAEYVETRRFPVKKNSQLFDRAAVMVGYMDLSGSVYPDNTDYVHTLPINVADNVGRTIYFSIDGAPSAPRFVTSYNADGFVVTSAGIDNGSGAAKSYTIPEGITSVVLSYVNPARNTQYARFQAEYDEITPYNEYGEFFEAGTTNGENSLSGKKWAVCGDSFTDGSRSGTLVDGQYKGCQKTYPYFIGNRTGVGILDFFDGGKTLAYPADGTFANSLCCPTSNKYYQNIPDDVDYITIYLGINDSHHASGTSGTDGEDVTGVIPLGTIDDTDTSTYYGAWNVVLTWLMEHRPFAHIGIIVSNGCDTQDYRTAQLAIARKYGVPFIDLNGDERTPVMIRSQNPDISSAVKAIVNKKQAVDYDGSATGTRDMHPNDEAHEYESHFIEAWLRTL